uniref:Zinc finger protein n=1 Tax=Phallusia mammillata TaxID=59560 RepID=A0A6F9DTZ5_9ASCI|nr:zinc finger protein [Phallusia mammillata]
MSLHVEVLVDASYIPSSVKSNFEMDENESTCFNEAIEQIMVEIELSVMENEDSSVNCDVCLKQFTSLKGMDMHKKRKHQPNHSQNVLDTPKLVELWTKASEKAATYTGAEPAVTALTQNLSASILAAYESSQSATAFTRRFLTLFHNDQLTTATRAVMSEILPTLANRKNLSPAGLLIKSNGERALNDIEKEVCCYIGGRVIRSLYHETGDPFFQEKIRAKTKTAGEFPKCVKQCLFPLN